MVELEAGVRPPCGTRMPRGAALREALLARNRAGHGDPLSATWGAFVLSGECR